MIVVKFPGGQFSFFGSAAFDFDYSRRPEIGPGELFFPRPDDLHGLSCSASQSRRFNRRVAGVLPSVCRTSVGSDDPDTAFWKMKNTRELIAIRKRALRAGPNRELAIRPLRHGCAWLERSVRDVCHVVGGV